MLILARDGAEEGLWLRAEQQTAGRGRLGRHWESNSGNLYCSGLVRLRADDPESPATLALVAALAAHEALSHFLPPDRVLMIKWPNDILADGAKLCGMLLERAADAIVVGVGANITGHPKGLDRPTTSLWALGATSSTAAYVMEVLVERFAHWVSVWRRAEFSVLRDHWLACAHAPGTPLRVSLPDGTTMDGQFSTLDKDGALILRLANGTSRVIHAGDVFLTGKD